ncbi:MAG: hypothetical protein CL797_11770 [Chromatiales bacterium]|nr:hypothetical protein [Chromatiales bacterium]
MRFIVLLCTLGCLAACHTDRLTPIDANAQEFRDCDFCPAMINVPAGHFLMGTAVEDRLLDPRTGKPAINDSPQHEVHIDIPFAIGKYEVTVAEFAEFVTRTGYQPESGCVEFSPPESFSIGDTVDWKNLGFEQPDDAPVGCVSYFDARAYADWLSDTTGQNYRLPSEAEWEFAARAGSTGPYHWGTDNTLACTYANVRSPGAHTISKRQAKADQQGFPCDDGKPLSSSVGSFQPNDLGLYDMQGNAWEWVADCNHKDYHGAPTDGSAWLDAVDTLCGCQFGVIRGGSYLNLVERSSTTVRNGRPQSGRGTNMGFRVARGTDISIAIKSRTAADNAFTDTPGAQLFRANCAACHVDRGTYRGIYGTDQASVERAIRGGGNNVMSMPAFTEVLSADEITQVARYVREQNDWD